MSDFERDLDAHVDGLTPPVPPPFDAVLARRASRRTRRRAAVGVVGSAAVVAAVIVGVSTLRPAGDAEQPPVTASDRSETSAGIPDVVPEWDEKGGPPVFLQLDGEQVVLEPWTSCYGNMCADGAPMPPFLDVGERETVLFSFPLRGWDFSASFTPMGGADCKRSFIVPVERTGDFTFEVSPAGPPDDYQVNLSGNGPGGDAPPPSGGPPRRSARSLSPPARSRSSPTTTTSSTPTASTSRSATWDRHPRMRRRSSP